MCCSTILMQKKKTAVKRSDGNKLNNGCYGLKRVMWMFKSCCVDSFLFYNCYSITFTTQICRDSHTITGEICRDSHKITGEICRNSHTITGEKSATDNNNRLRIATQQLDNLPIDCVIIYGNIPPIEEEIWDMINDIWGGIYRISDTACQGIFN